MTTPLFVHPLTGELLEATLESLEAATNAASKEIGRLYRARDVLLPSLAELRGPYLIPPPAMRTEKQNRIARCPKCTERLSLDD